MTKERMFPSPFRQVEASEAGPNALGILLPPGRRTLVLLRPRCLEWDLVPIRPDGSEGPQTFFWEVDRVEGQKLVEEFRRGLEDWASGGLGRVEPMPAPGGKGYQVRAGIARFVLIACERIPGAPYKPAVFDAVSAALSAGERITSVLRPGPGAIQEIYFNTENFRK